MVDMTSLSFDVAFLSAALATLLTLFHITKHLQNYHQPTLQRHTIRIVFMVVVMGISSILALIFPGGAVVYMLTIRDCYDAFVIYNFVALCIALAGGPGAIVSQSEHVVVRHCCLPPQAVDGAFLRRCKQGTLQFVVAKPILAALSLALLGTGHLTIGDWSPHNGYLYLMICYNLTYSIALFFLLMFYLGTRELLHDYRPGVKFLLIKAVIFVTFWQGVALAILLKAKVVGGLSEAEYIQNVLMCIECLLSSVCMMVAFPWSEYAAHKGSARLSQAAEGAGGSMGGGTSQQKMSFWRALVHVVSIWDVGQDMVHSYDSTYSSYVEVNDEKDPILDRHMREALKEEDKQRLIEDNRRKEQGQMRKKELTEMVFMSKPPQSTSMPFVLEDLEEERPIVKSDDRRGGGSLAGWLEEEGDKEDHNQDLPVSYGSKH